MGVCANLDQSVMLQRHQISRAAIELIKAFEGYRPTAARLADGRWTIGHGHTKTAREGASVSESDAEALLIYDLIEISERVHNWTFTPLSQNQFDALCAFAFNIGVEDFRTSPVLRLVNEGQMLQAAGAMELWRRADFEGESIVVDGLVRRRVAEMALFLTPQEGWIPAPSPVLRPQLDRGAEGLTEKPAVLTVAMKGEQAVATRQDDPLPPPSATQRAVAALTNNLRTILKEPAVAAPTVQEDKQDPVSPAAPTAVDISQSLPEPNWPVRVSAAENAFVLTSPPDPIDLPPPLEVKSERLASIGDGQPTLFDPRVLSLGVTEDRSDDELGSPERFSASMGSGFDEMDERSSAPMTLPNLLPVIGLAILGAGFVTGGLLWSGTARGSAGTLSPWIIGWIACLAGVVFLAMATYLFLKRLGHLDVSDDTADETRLEVSKV